MKRLLILALAANCAICVTNNAHAAGFYFSDRGVRPMGRAGAFVAGADDLHSIWYNPAGLSEAGTGLLLDFAWLRFGIDYSRELRVLDADGTYKQFREQTVSGRSPILPLPTIAGSYQFGKEKQWTVAGGFFAPYVALASFDSTVNGQPSPARYMVGTFDGSALGNFGTWVAYKPVKQLSVGLGVQALAGMIQTDVTFTASPQDRLLGAPEQPEFDANARAKVGPFFAPSANVGITIIPSVWMRIGLSAQLPTFIDTAATVQMRMPTSAIFDSAKQVGDQAHIRMQFPAIMRFGIEVRPSDDIRFELAYVREFWSIHKTIEIENTGMRINGVVGMPPEAKIPNLSMAREYEDAHSIRAGGELRSTIGGYKITIRAGASYEQSAIPTPYLSLNALDFEKVMLTVGGTLYVGKHWALDAVYAHMFTSSVYVPPAEAKIPRLNPLKGNAENEPVNGGQYDSTADLLGVGVRYSF